MGDTVGEKLLINKEFYNTISNTGGGGRI